MNIDMPASKSMSLFPASKVSLRGSLGTVRAADSGIPGQTWSINARIDCNEGQTDNQLQVQLTRTTPGQKDLKVYAMIFKFEESFLPVPYKSVVASGNTRFWFKVTAGDVASFFLDFDKLSELEYPDWN